MARYYHKRSIRTSSVDRDMVSFGRRTEMASSGDPESMPSFSSFSSLGAHGACILGPLLHCAVA